MLLKNSLIFVFLIFACFDLSSQTISSETFSVVDVLASTKFHNVTRNNEGVELEKYPRENDLPNNVHYHLYKDNNGKIWLTSLPSQLGYFEKRMFFKTTPIIIAVTALLFSLLFIGYRITLKRVKRKEELKRHIQNLRFEALNAHMNPHFMFNSFNTIQNFIMQKEKKASIHYLSKFARLMRMTLNHSQSKNITLFEELKALQLYMDLERLRFDDQFNYELYVNPLLNQENTLVPALLIQPIVENAILHGIRPKGELGQVWVVIELMDDQLLIEISDNGVGKNSKLNKKIEGRASKGIPLTKERVTLFAKDFNGQYRFDIVDLTNGKDTTGTRVEISIPFVSKM